MNPLTSVKMAVVMEKKRKKEEMESIIPCNSIQTHLIPAVSPKRTNERK